MCIRDRGDSTWPRSEPKGGRSSARAAIERARHGARAPVQNVRVDHRRRNIGLAEQLLHGAYVMSALEQVSGKGVSQGVAAHVLRDARRPCSLLYAADEVVLVDMMALHRPAARIGRK